MSTKRRKSRSHAKPTKLRRYGSRARSAKRRRHSAPVEPPSPPTDERNLIHPSVWFRREVADDLWMPPRSSLRAIAKPRPMQRPSQELSASRLRLPEEYRVVKPLLTSYYEITNYASDERPSPWRTEAMPLPPPAQPPLPPVDSMQQPGHDVAVAEVTNDITAPRKREINSTLKLRLYPSAPQREKLAHMFATHRAVYNKLVARSRDDFAQRLFPRDTAQKKMTKAQFFRKYRPISAKGMIHKHFRNKSSVRRHLKVTSRVFGSAFRDFRKAVNSSLALYFSLIQNGKPTTYPELKFKSKFAVSNTIELSAEPGLVNAVRGGMAIRFFPRYFGFSKDEGIALREKLPSIEHCIRLQRLREGDYYILIPRYNDYMQARTSRVCSIDPGVCNFATIYDPCGRTLSVSGSVTALKNRFESIDTMQSVVTSMQSDCKPWHQSKIRSRVKAKFARSGGAVYDDDSQVSLAMSSRSKYPSKSREHRDRYRLRRCIRYTQRRVSRLIRDMHHKVSSWLAANYDQVLLPAFNTSDMVRRFDKRATIDGSPGVCQDAAQQVPAGSKTRKRKIASPVARAMLAQAHYRFKELLRYKLGRVGGQLIVCTEEYTSKTCSRCGAINASLGGNRTFKCSLCLFEQDRDVNAAKNILHMNIQMLG